MLRFLVSLFAFLLISSPCFAQDIYVIEAKSMEGVLKGVDLKSVPVQVLAKDCIANDNASYAHILKCNFSLNLSTPSPWSADAKAYASSLRSFIGSLYPVVSVIFASVAIPKVVKGVFSGLW
jgi:hypothetical protein